MKRPNFVVNENIVDMDLFILRLNCYYDYLEDLVEEQGKTVETQVLLIQQKDIESFREWWCG